MGLLQVRSKVDDDICVVKKVQFDGTPQSEAEAALREGQVLSLLRHPHVVPYKEVGEVGAKASGFDYGSPHTAIAATRAYRQVTKTRGARARAKVWGWPLAGWGVAGGSEVGAMPTRQRRYSMLYSHPMLRAS